MTDIFEFWAEAGDQRVHPRDQRVLERLPHHFDLNCYGSSYYGPLRTAPIVLLYLSFGLTDFDQEEGRTGAGAARYAGMRTGVQDLPGPDENPIVHKWWTERTAQFGAPDDLKSQVAVLNLAAYHSTKFTDWSLLAPLASTRATLDWAHNVLFPQAEAGERSVICLRAARCWGLPRGEGDGDSGSPNVGPFSPPTTPNGHMHSGALRDDIIGRVRSRLGGPPAG